jgi:hypothetical protein
MCGQRLGIVHELEFGNHVPKKKSCKIEKECGDQPFQVDVKKVYEIGGEGLA